jgi:uncharacterized membrane protein YedE/YeeE
MDSTLILAILFGGIFGFLLHKGNVVNYNVIVNQFRLKDFTVVRVMLTAVIVGGIGVYLLNQAGLAQYHIKSADLLGVVLGSALFGVGMVLYGYCPGTGVAAIGTGSTHALVGGVGMIVGGILYALNFSWIKENILTVWSYGKVRLPEITGIPEPIFWIVLPLFGLVVFRMINKFQSS